MEVEPEKSAVGEDAEQNQAKFDRVFVCAHVFRKDC